MTDRDEVVEEKDTGNKTSEFVSSVFATSVKVPQFYKENARFWFDGLESQFRLKKVSDDTTKFDHVMSALPEEVAMQVMPAIRSKRYEELKEALLNVYGLTEQQRALKLLSLPGLGDKKPSKLAAEIIALVPEGLDPGYLERQIFLNQLPTAVQQLMMTHKEVKDLYQLGRLADDYVMTMHSRELASAVAACNVADVSACAAATGPRFSGYAGGGWLCWRHARFGLRATNCEDMAKCQWKSPRGGGTRPHRGNYRAGRR